MTVSLFSALFLIQSVFLSMSDSDNNYSFFSLCLTSRGLEKGTFSAAMFAERRLVLMHQTKDSFIAYNVAKEGRVSHFFAIQSLFAKTHFLSSRLLLF